MGIAGGDTSVGAVAAIAAGDQQVTMCSQQQQQQQQLEREDWEREKQQQQQQIAWLQQREQELRYTNLNSLCCRQHCCDPRNIEERASSMEELLFLSWIVAFF